MQIVYQAANSLDAHVVKDVLRQQGIAAVVLGEHLQGAVGELQAANLVRLEVADEDVDAARRVVAEWEAANPAPEQGGTTHRSATVQGSTFWLALGAAYMAGLATAALLLR